MVGFSKVKSVRSRLPAGATVFSRLYSDAINTKYIVPTGRAPEFRPSAFPICSILTYVKLIKGCSSGYWEREKSFAGDFFTSIGTQAHSVTQYHIGDSGQIWGNWKCINPQCAKSNDKITRTKTTNNKCPACQTSMEYVEIEIKYKGLTGHIDCIIYLGNNMYWVGDYKTTTKYKLDSGKLPEKQHLLQIPAYVWVLRTKYKMNVVGFSLLYLSRDNPFKFIEKPFKWNDKWQHDIGKMIKRQRQAYQAALTSLFNQDHKQAVEHKLCSSREYYDKHVNYYTPCPLLDVCFSPKRLRKELIELEEEYSYSKKQGIKLYEYLSLD